MGPGGHQRRRADGVADGGTLIIALPEILRDLHTDIFSLLWIVVGYTLVATVLVLNAGRIADMVGRARSYTLGFVIFTAGLDPVRPRARTPQQLILWRLVQGVGGALLMANATALVTDAFPRPELGKALGINGMVIGAGAILGPILGGWLTGFGWRTIFWFNVPIGLRRRRRRRADPGRAGPARLGASRSTGSARCCTSSA